MNPSFIILGAQKAGTSSLFNILSQHRDVLKPIRKEVRFFTTEDWYNENNYNSYHACFPIKLMKSAKAISFEATPEYLYNKDVPKRLLKYNPNLKFIVLVRNPSERALSGWTMYHHHFSEGRNSKYHDPRSFDQAIKEEIELIESGSETDFRSYVKRGFYYNQISNYLDHFDRSQILVLENKELKNDFGQTVDKVLDFLELKKQKLETRESNKRKVKNFDSYDEQLSLLNAFYYQENIKLFDLLDVDFGWNDWKTKSSKT